MPTAIPWKLSNVGRFKWNCAWIVCFLSAVSTTRRTRSNMEKTTNVSSRNNWQAAKSRDFCGLLNLSRKFSFFGRLFERFILVKSSSTCHVTMVFLMQEFVKLSCSSNCKLHYTMCHEPMCPLVFKRLPICKSTTHSFLFTNKHAKLFHVTGPLPHGNGGIGRCNIQKPPFDSAGKLTLDQALKQ